MWRAVAATTLAGSALLVSLAWSGAATAADDATLTWGTRPTNNAVGEGRPNFEFTADPGGALHDSIDVFNHSDVPITVAVYAADAFTSQAGGVDALPAGEESQDVGAWIELDADSVTVEPQETVAVPFTLVVPASATPGDHTGAILTSILTGAGGTPLAVDRRIGSRVMIRVAGDLTPRLSISGLQVRFRAGANPFKPGRATVTYSVSNTGNVKLDAHRKVRLSGPFGIASKTSVLDDIGELLPGSSRSFTDQVDDVWGIGRLKATVTLSPFALDADSGDPVDISPVSSSRTIWVAQRGHLAAIPALIAAAAGGYLWRRRRRAAVAAAIDKAVADALSTTPVDSSATVTSADGAEPQTNRNS